MEGESTRQQKIARQLQRDLAEIIRSKGMAAYNGAMVTVSEVRVTPDLSQAKVYVSISEFRKAAQRGVGQAGGKTAQDSSGTAIFPRYLFGLRGAYRRTSKKVMMCTFRFS